MAALDLFSAAWQKSMRKCFVCAWGTNCLQQEHFDLSFCFLQPWKYLRRAAAPAGSSSPLPLLSVCGRLWWSGTDTNLRHTGRLYYSVKLEENQTLLFSKLLCFNQHNSWWNLLSEGTKSFVKPGAEKKLQYKVFWCHHSVYLTRCSSCIFSVWVQHSQKHPDWLHWRCSDALFFRHFCHFSCTSSFHSKNSICRDLDSSQIIHHSHSHGQRHFPLFFSFSLIKSRHVQASENISNMTKIKTCMTDVRHTHTHQSCIHVRGRKLQKQNWNLFGEWEQRFA